MKDENKGIEEGVVKEQEKTKKQIGCIMCSVLLTDASQTCKIYINLYGYIAYRGSLCYI